MSQLLGIVAGAIVGYIAGVFLERQRTREWARKEQWQFKRDLYVDVMTAIAELRFLTGMRLYQLQSVLKSDDDAAAPETDEGFVTANVTLVKTGERVRAFLSDEVNTAFEALKDTVVKHLEADKRRDKAKSEVRFQELMTEKLMELANLVAAEGRKDFGSLLPEEKPMLRRLLDW